MKLVGATTILAGLALAACSPAEDEQAATGGQVDAETPSAAVGGEDGDPPAVIEADAEPRLTAEGWGPLRIGMTRDEVTAALGEDANPGAVGGPDPGACDMFRPQRAPEGMMVMLEQDRLTRITLSDGSEVETDAGIAVGAPARAISEAYGEGLQSSPHNYVGPPAKYLTHWARGGEAGQAYVQDAGARGIRYEVGEDGRVQLIHAGGPSIQYVEGCL